MPAPDLKVSDMNHVIDEAIELLDELRAAGEDFWDGCEAEAERQVQAGVREGHLSFSELDATRDALARILAVGKMVDFMQEQGLGDQVDRLMFVDFSEAEVLALQDGEAPEREIVEAFRMRCLLVHYAYVQDAADQLRAGVIDGQ